MSLAKRLALALAPLLVLAGFAIAAEAQQEAAQDAPEAAPPEREAELPESHRLMGDEPNEHVIYALGPLGQTQVSAILAEITKILRETDPDNAGVVGAYPSEPRIFLVVGHFGGLYPASISELADFIRIAPAEFVVVLTGRTDFNTYEIAHSADLTIALPYSSILFRYSAGYTVEIDYNGFTADDFAGRIAEVTRTLNNILAMLDILKEKVVSSTEVTAEQFDNYVRYETPVSAMEALRLGLVDYVDTPKIAPAGHVKYILTEE